MRSVVRAQWIGICALISGLGCHADVATQTLVLLHAEPGYEDATELEVRVERGDGTVAEESVHPLGTPRPEPLAKLPLIPEGGDASRSFRVRARLRDAAGTTIAEVEASGGYEVDALRELHLWFESSCRGVLDCGRGRTCQQGSCVGSCFEPLAAGSETRSRPSCGECQLCSDRICASVPDDSPCGCPADRCSGGTCRTARPAAVVIGGQLHTCAGIDQYLYCWGSNRVGQLGTGGTSTISPVKLATNGWTEGTAAQDHTCMLAVGGGRSCWGWNGLGQLGLGTEESAAQRTPISAPADDPKWTTLASGWFHTCGLTKDRQLGCWGTNDRGASAEPPTGNTLLPKMVDDAHDWSAVAAGGFHSCGLKSDGTIWCWGLNESGELGVGDSADRDSPIQTGCPGGSCLADWSAIGAGSFHTCAIRGDGELWCWGGGLNGQLGVGPTASEDSAVPRRVEDGRWRAITGGQSHTCGLQDDGSLWCWGKNDQGQLGVGDTEPRFSPEAVLVPGKNEWIRIGAGREHTCAIRSDRSLWCWGKNDDGQLGIGKKTTPGELPITRPTRVCLPST